MTLEEESAEDFLRRLSETVKSIGGVRFVAGQVEVSDEQAFKALLPAIHQKLIDRKTVALVIGVVEEVTYNYLYIGDELLAPSLRHQAANKLVETFNASIGSNPNPVFTDRVSRAIDETLSGARRLLFGNDYPIQ
jgi:hypothetical protein